MDRSGRWLTAVATAAALVAGGLAAAGGGPALAAAGAQPVAAPKVGSGGGPIGPAQLTALRAAVAAATRRAGTLAGALQLASARTANLRVVLDELYQAQAVLSDQLAAQVRALYEAGPPDPWLALANGLVPDTALVGIGAGRRAGVDLRLVGRIDRLSTEAAELRSRLLAVRRSLLGRAEAAETAVQQAAELLADAQHRYQLQQAAAAALAAQQRVLASLSALVTQAVTVPSSPAELALLAQQAPLLASLQAAGSGLPRGYLPTDTVFSGVASWYGPGFVGSPTASGAPYDPQQLTCAMLLVPLGTVVHVQSGTAAVNCLVNDRGPYVAGRIIDMSPAGADALGFTGLALVQVTVLAPTG